MSLVPSPPRLLRYTFGPHDRITLGYGTPVLIEHPALGMIDVPAGRIPELAYQPTLHVNYGEKVLAVRDGLPKFKDFPKDFGGSGEAQQGAAVTRFDGGNERVELPMFHVHLPGVSLSGQTGPRICRLNGLRSRLQERFDDFLGVGGGDDRDDLDFRKFAPTENPTL